MVIVLKVSFSPARERILLTGSVQRDSPESRAVPCGEEPGAPVQAGHQRGGPALTAATPGRSFSHHGVLIKCRLCGNRPHSSPRRACGDCPAFQAAPLRKWRVQSVAGYPNIQGDTSWPGVRHLVQVTGSSSVSAPTSSLTVGHRPFSRKLSRQSGDTWERMECPPRTPQQQPGHCDEVDGAP